VTGARTFSRALLLCLSLIACGSNERYTSGGSATSEGANSPSSGGDAAGYGPQSYDGQDYGAQSAPEPAAAPSPMAPSGEMTVAGGRISRSSPVLQLDVSTLAKAKGQSAIDAAETLARDAGGYLVHRDQRRITVRVPAEKFQPTLAAVLLLGDVLHREVSVRDVTEEFRDLRIRLRNAEAVRDRLEQLLARADKVEQALAVERELERVAGEIEQIKGRLSMLQELIAFSTITVELRPRAIDHLQSRVRLPFPWLDELGLSGLLSL
jgi:hypothetical protein